MPDKTKQKSHVDDELEVLEYWDEHQIFQKSINQRPEGNPYVFYDGPPFATGLPHYGHVLPGVMKDVMPRFFTMKGYRVERKWGWDCHGLPIENIVEKKHDLGSKAAIENFGVDKFNEACHAEVMRYEADWKRIVRRLGRWVDMERDYKTMDLSYMESTWWVFKSLWDKGLIYEGRKPMHVCPRCETVLSNFEVAQGYQDVKDISVYVTLPITSGDYQNAALIAWTTTPWTLPGNMLAAVLPQGSYAVVSSEGADYIVHADLAKDVFEGKDHQITKTIKGSDLVGATYEPLFPFYKDTAGAFTIKGADFVSESDGTGIVHIAGGFGADDVQLTQAEGLDPIMHVGFNGHFAPEVADPLQEAGYNVKDKPVKQKGDTQSVDIEIVKYLAHNDRLFRKEKVEHSYPHCWRCDTPLLNYATASWFVRVTDLKDRLIATNKEINWVPENIKEGRFGKWLEGARDWAISRSRYWGTPLPIWRAEDGDIICIGSQEELETLSGQKVDDLHKHIVDNIVIKKDGKEFTRIPEVLDCWFESGSMPYAQFHYPFENKDKFQGGFPAEFIAEGQDQTRGWFYTLHVLANALFDMPAFKNVAVNGIVLAEDGKKMSKRLKNYPDITNLIEKHGSDAMRYYLMASPAVKAENLRFSEKGVEEVAKKFIRITRNVLAFYKLHAASGDNRAPSLAHPLDAWITSRANQTLSTQTEALERYDIMSAMRPLQAFATDLSTWYIRRSRDRMKSEGEDKQEAIATLKSVLDLFAHMLAPCMPFMAEVLYQGVNGNFKDQNTRLSVHLESWPEAGAINQEILDAMGEARAIVSRALEVRESAGIPIKQPLASLRVTLPSGGMTEQIKQVILDELNIKSMSLAKGDIAVEVDLELTPELTREGMARDVARKINQLRKEANLTIQTKVDLFITSESEDVKTMLTEHAGAIKSATLASSLTQEKGSAKIEKTIKTNEQEIWIGISYE